MPLTGFDGAIQFLADLTGVVPRVEEFEIGPANGYGLEVNVNLGVAGEELVPVEQVGIQVHEPFRVGLLTAGVEKDHRIRIG